MSALAARLEDDGCPGDMPEGFAALKARVDAAHAAVGQLSPPPAGQGNRGSAASAGGDNAALPLGATGAAPTGATSAPTHTPAGQATRCSAGEALPEIAVAAVVSSRAGQTLAAEVRHQAGQALAAQQGRSCGVAVHDSTDAALSARAATDQQEGAAGAQAQAGNAAAHRNLQLALM